jgi:class 3 adenylate cyclase/predicted ATPase
MDIAAWLRGLGLEQYEQAFLDNAIEAETLSELNDADLEKLGVLLGHRKRVLKAIAELRRSAGYPDAEVPPRTDEPQVCIRVAEPTGERRQLTVMFSDLVGSTALSAQLDPEEMREILRAYHRTVAHAIARFEGHVAKYMGDGVLAYFGYPRAHEDEAERAVYAGLAIIEAMRTLRAPEGKVLQVRVGIATGPVVVGDLIGEGAAQEEMVIGETPNVAARLQTLAEPGAVVIGARTRRLLGRLFDLDDLGTHRLKGLTAPVRVWRVLGESHAESRFEALHTAHLTPLIGREHEIGLLLERWERAQEGEGQVMLLCGEPGIGKSRLVRALRERLDAEPYTPLSHYCSPHRRTSPLHPVVGLLERAAGFAQGDLPEQRLAKLEALLALSASDIAAVAALLAGLLGIPTGDRYPSLIMSPQRQKECTLEALTEQLAGLAARQPVLAVFEDAHWSDPTTLELLDLIVDRVQTLRVLVIITFRPEFAAPWTHYAHVSSLTLGRLSRRQGAAMIGRVTGGKALPPALLAQIVAKTDGVPLFVEELTRAVLETGLLKEEGDAYALMGALPLLEIPATLQDSLMARLDRLAPAREAAQVGAAIGREFSHDLLAAVAQMPEAKLNEALTDLVDAGLVFRRGTPPQASYAFKHALVRDAAYATLLRDKRRRLHERIAEVLERMFPETAEGQSELIAHHWTEAGHAERAIEYWLKAGQAAIKRSATAEAIAQLKRGLELLSTLPADPERDRKELPLRTTLGGALIAAKGFSAEETGQAWMRARELSTKVPDNPHLGPVLYGQYVFHVVRSEMKEALGIAQELLCIAERHRDPVLRLMGHRTIGNAQVSMGEFAPARGHLEQVLALYDPAQHRSLAIDYTFDPRVASLSYLSLALFALGYSDQALARSREAVSGARELSHLNSLAQALFFAGILRQLLRDPQEARVHADALISLATEQGFPYWLAGARIVHGWAAARQGRPEEGLVEMHDAMAAYMATGARHLVSYFTTLIVEAELHSTPSEDSIAGALSRTKSTGERWIEAELNRLQGELLLLLAPPQQGEAEACFHRALAVARQQGAKMWELRTATRLARLWRDQGKLQDAHNLLSLSYECFTEGLDMPDLREAKLLLSTCGDSSLRAIG